MRQNQICSRTRAAQPQMVLAHDHQHTPGVARGYLLTPFQGFELAGGRIPPLHDLFDLLA